MTCRRFRKSMVLDIYGELEDREHRRLKGHLSRCAACREEFERTSTVLASLDRDRVEEIPEPDWDRSWKAVQAGLQKTVRRARGAAFLPRWAYAPLALAVLFVLGVFVGRYWLSPRPAGTGAVTASRSLSPAAVRTVLADYFDDLTPLLLEFANDRPGAAGPAGLQSDREMAASLLVENMLLKRALARRNPGLADLFDDLEMILTEISNLKHRDTSTPALVQQAINERQILPRIRRQEQT
jgi:hypothetical protein